MQGNLTVIQHYEPFVSSFILAKELQTEHRRLRELARKYKSEFGEFGSFMCSGSENGEGNEIDSRRPDGNESVKKKQRGGQKKEIFFNEGQAIYLLVLLGNTDRVRNLKKKLAKDFINQRKFISQVLARQQNEEWIKNREEGKINRRIETDIIKKFVDYATKQGSKNASKYYMNITKMQNNTLFSLDFLNQKFDNIRDIVSTFSLSALQVCDKIVANSIVEEMNKGTHYKEIFQKAKEKVENFSNYIGKLEVCQAIPGIDICHKFTLALN